MFSHHPITTMCKRHDTINKHVAKMEANTMWIIMYSLPDAEIEVWFDRIQPMSLGCANTMSIVDSE